MSVDPAKAVPVSVDPLSSEAVSLDSGPGLPDPAAPLDRPELPPLPPVTVLFAACVAAAPGAVAVRQGERALSYGELADAASRLAGALLARGVAPGERVVIYGRRSPGLVAALIGVMAAGGVVLVIEPDLPDERKARMVEIGGARRLVRVEPGAVPAWAAGLDAVALDPATGGLLGALPAAEDVRPADLAAPRAGSDPAYVFFTSGTTGLPKGVVGCFAGLSQFLLWERETLGIGPEDRVSQLTRLSFDAMLRDTFLPLTSGACLCLPRPEDEAPSRVVGWLDREGITVLHVVPSLARLWLAGGRDGASELASLRWTLFTGEPLADSLVRDWRRAFPRSGRQVNFYGPTETTLIKFFDVLGPRDEDLAPGIQPVGRPLPQTQGLVLDGDRLCGVGEVGEVAIRTPFRTLGYLGGSAAERARFRVNPFTADPEDVIYQTGDLGRYRPDGTLEVLGRIDDQVKIRGVRVEPAEVEAALRGLPGVRDAAVAAREVAPGDPQLVAWYVAEETQAPEPAALRRALEAVLPAALVPAWFVRLDRLPLNHNGKLDRRALPTPAAPVADGAGRAPETELEQALAALWGEVLGLEAVGSLSVEQDFFTLGGHSVKALMLATAIERELGVAVPAGALFERTTVAQQAAWIEEVRRYDERHVARSYLTFGEGRPGKLFAFPPLLGYGLAFYQMAQAISDHTVHAFDFPEEGVTEDPIAAWADEVTRIDPEGPYRLVGYSAGGNLAFEVAAELERRGKRVDAVVMLDARRFVEPEILSDAEIEDLVWTNLDNLAAFLLQDEQFRDFVRNRYARERMAAKTRAFLRWERGRTNDGPVRADIHFLCGTDRKVCHDWEAVTSGRFLVYEASGRHIEMTHASHGEANGRLIETILGPPGASDAPGQP